uniref:Integrase catalytic domain-containing protein n=1 Tax=Haemonchus placei TaxID=6290 RepID=A0A0N4W5C2_HAEPC
MATRGIIWKTIVPYAPWQGGFYEKMIKSIKIVSTKLCNGRFQMRKPSKRYEIEGCVNTIPLTYQEEKWNETPALRPIVFIQRDMVVTYPCECSEEDKTDHDYLPADGAVILQTRQQT